jgi:[ribosomal protein S5]-alanine N-acetyltransferase
MLTPGGRGDPAGAAGDALLHRGYTLGRVLPEGYTIRELAPSDAAALAASYVRNRAHLEPWEPTRDESFFTYDGQVAAVSAQLAAVRAGMLGAWVLLHGDDVVGRVNLNNIVQGVLRSGSLGYWVDGDHLGRGLASAGVEHVCEQALGRGLHRVEAGTLLDNHASQRVLERCGFEQYGVARRFLFIAGAWRDHRLYQRILHDRPLTASP